VVRNTPGVSDSPSPIAQESENPTYRRRYVRIATSFPVSFVLDGSDEVVAGESSDLGGGGVRLATEGDLPLGALLLLRFRIPSIEREIAVRGRIVLSFFNAERRQFLHGVAFTHVDPTEQEAIVRYVAGEVRRVADESVEAEI